MSDLWTRRASFLTGLLSALGASAVLSAADLLAALRAQPAELQPHLAADLAWRVVGLDLLLAFPVGLWLGIVLYGALGQRPPRQVLVWLGERLSIRSRAAETERLALAVAALASAAVAGAVLFALAFPIFGRIVRSRNAAAAVVAAAVVALLAALSLAPTLLSLARRGLAGRERLLRRRLGVVSLPMVLLVAVAAGGVVLAYLAAHADQLLYGVDLTPVWWGLGYAAALLGALCLSCWHPVERLVSRMARPLMFALANVTVGAAVVVALQMATEAGAHAELLDGSGVASRVYSTLSGLGSKELPPEPPPVIVQPQPQVADTGSKAPDVILITVDALRADHLGLYGYSRGTSPNIDVLGRLALTFDQAYAPAPCTASSFAGLLTSRLPSRIPGAIQENEHFEVAEGTPTFVEHFRRAGYRTVGLLPLISDYLALVKQGFDVFDGYFGSSQSLSERLIKHLSREREDGKPLFIWAHYLDVHYPYQSWPGWSDFGDSPQDRYDQEIAYTDSQLAGVFAQLQWLGYLERAVIVFSADHGEAFMEHGTRLHGDNLYQEQIHVPLLLMAPGLPQGKRFPGRVSLLDLGPTLVDLAGIDAVGYATEGGSLLARLKGLDSENPEILVDSCRIGSQFALVGEHKLYYLRQVGAFYLYDLLADPREQLNIFHQAPDVAAPLVRRLRSEVAKVLAR